MDKGKKIRLQVVSLYRIFVCFADFYYLGLKMRSAQTHYCAWAIMKKFIYLHSVNIVASYEYNILQKYEQTMNMI